mmetsp:Transcript_52974/g.172425  ORF Transcript_52974/g.172425 Transcript_52974/m.172425 type:complete len:203 (-) Transcript_52974:711-1319(-)
MHTATRPWTDLSGLTCSPWSRRWRSCAVSGSTRRTSGFGTCTRRSWRRRGAAVAAQLRRALLLLASPPAPPRARPRHHRSTSPPRGGAAGGAGGCGRPSTVSSRARTRARPRCCRRPSCGTVTRWRHGPPSFSMRAITSRATRCPSECLRWIHTTSQPCPCTSVHSSCWKRRVLCFMLRTSSSMLTPPQQSHGSRSVATTTW